MKATQEEEDDGLSIVAARMMARLRATSEVQAFQDRKAVCCEIEACPSLPEKYFEGDSFRVADQVRESGSAQNWVKIEP